MSHASLRRRRDPIQPGTSIGHEEKKGGTLTAIVTNVHGDVLALSSLHVLQRKKREIGASVVQPGTRDVSTGRPSIIGSVKDGYLGIDGDASVAYVRHRDVEDQVLELGVRASSIGRVSVGDLVVKVGRSTGVTVGRVRQSDYVNRVAYDRPLRTTRVSGFVIEQDLNNPPPENRLSKGGDSGAPYFRYRNNSATPELVGIHTSSVSTSPRWAFASHAELVFERLGLSLF